MLKIINFKKLGYRKTPTITVMIAKLEEETIFSKLILVQQHELQRIKNILNDGKTLCQNYVHYLRNLYLTYVLQQEVFKVRKTVNSETHIGMKMFNSLCA